MLPAVTAPIGDDSELVELAQILPAPYSSLLPELASSLAPREHIATCHDCAMRPRGEPVPGVDYFDPDSKCCTFHPSVPNFLVGALLADTDPALDEGRRRVRDRIARRLGATPRGLEPPRGYSMRYRALEPRGFGVARSLRCPLHDAAGGECTIWRFREATCLTFHCKHAHGADGLAYWASLQGALAHAQRELALLAMHRLGIDRGFVLGLTRREPTADEIESEVTPDSVHRSMFGSWSGREEAFYLRCHEVVGALSADEVARAVGTRGDVHAAELAARLEAIRTPAMPACLERNPRLRAFPADGDRFLVAAFSDRQPLRLRRRLLRALDRFDGVTPTAQVLERIRAEDGFVVDASTVLRLWRHRILQGGRCGDPGQDAGEPLR